MFLPKSICVCILRFFKSVASRGCIAKLSFLFVFWPDMDTKMGVVIYIYIYICT